MRLTNIDDCNRELFYKQCGGKDSLITVETCFNMLMALPTFDLASHEKQIKDEVIKDIYNIVISDISDEEKVLKIQYYIFNIKEINCCESERV